MKKLLKNEVAKLKLEIKNRYLAGESVPSIAREKGVVSRTIYYHLGELTAQEKGMHAQNAALRKNAEKGKASKVTNEKKQKKETNIPKTKKVKEKSEDKKQAGKSKSTSLADFIEG